jgi:hypothetical protein
MSYEGSRIVVIADDRTVIVDGLPYKCLDEVDQDLHALQWDPQRQVPGHVFKRFSTSHGFTSFDMVKPYAEAWARYHAAAMAEVRAELETKKREAAEQTAELSSALRMLEATDHEVIKAAERFLAGSLPPDLILRRREARETVKRERDRLSKIKQP